MNNYAVIMAGGAGTRFWPKGTSRLPKQFLKIADTNDTMIQQTFKRLHGLFNTTKIFVVTNINHKAEVKRQLPQIPEENIICEPFGRNTAPCIGLASLFIKNFDEKAGVLVVASDHIIKDTQEFHRVVKHGLKFVNQNGGIVTLGITPTGPETGYGYIQFDPEHSHVTTVGNTEEEEKFYKVKTFAEKPNVELAKTFIDSGDFLWNSGMFIFRVDTMMEEIEKSLPDLSQSLGRLQKCILDKDFQRNLEDEYGKIKGISIDYGVMEKSSNVHTIKSNFDWSDVGSWDEIYNLRDKDSDGNVKEGKVVVVNSKNCLVVNDQRITALVGVDDLLVVDTDNGLLICKRGESQNVREVVDYLKRKGLEQYL